MRDCRKRDKGGLREARRAGSRKAFSKASAPHMEREKPGKRTA
jgi:hypothetical protein